MGPKLRADTVSSILDFNRQREHIRVMKSRSHLIRITVEENVARWLRAEAAKSNTSISCFLSAILKERINEAADYEAAKRRSLTRDPFLKSGGSYLTRDEVHERSR
jgi:hypothetical protein